MDVNSLTTAFSTVALLINPVTLHAAAPIAALIAEPLPITDMLISVASMRNTRPLAANPSLISCGRFVLIIMMVLVSAPFRGSAMGSSMRESSAMITISGLLIIPRSKIVPSDMRV